MRFTQSQFDNYTQRCTRPQQASQPRTPKIDLDAKPTLLEVTGEQAHTVMHAVKERGGAITGLIRGKQNGRWHLTIHWPENNNTII